MSTHREVQVDSPGGALRLVEVATTSPPAGHVRIAVRACGVCGTDHAFVNGGFPNLSWPMVSARMTGLRSAGSAANR